MFQENYSFSEKCHCVGFGKRTIVINNCALTHQWGIKNKKADKSTFLKYDMLFSY